jgi:hypothetical protein
MVHQFAAKHGLSSFASCRFIEGGASFHYSSVHVCSVPHHHRGQPFVSDFDGKKFPLEKLLALRDELREQNQSPDGHPTCRGCALLETKSWEYEPYVFEYLGLGNWLYCNIECSYCELQTKNLATYAMTFQPYLLESTIRRFIDERLLAPTATIDWGGGGEPTFYRDFPGVLAMLLDHGTFNYIHTNGTRDPKTLRISRPDRVHLICSVDAGLAETYFLIKRRDYLERVWANLSGWSAMGALVSVKYIMKKENCGEDDLTAFAERAGRLRPASVIVDIDFDFPQPGERIVSAIVSLQQRIAALGIPVSYGHTGDRFTPEAGVAKKVEQAAAKLVQIEGTPVGMSKCSTAA